MKSKENPLRSQYVKNELVPIFRCAEAEDLCSRLSYDYLGDGLSGSQERLTRIETMEFSDNIGDQIGQSFLRIARDLQNLWHERKTPKSDITIKPCDRFALLLPVILPDPPPVRDAAGNVYQTHSGVCVSRLICDIDRKYISVSEPLVLTTRRPSPSLRNLFWTRKHAIIRFIERVYLAFEDRLQFETNDFLRESFRDFVLAGYRITESCSMGRIPPRNPDPYKSYTERMEELFPGTKPAILL